MLIRPPARRRRAPRKHEPAEQEVRKRRPHPRHSAAQEARPGGIPQQREGEGGIEAAERGRRARRSPLSSRPVPRPAESAHHSPRAPRSTGPAPGARRTGSAASIAPSTKKRGAMRRQGEPTSRLTATVLDDEGQRSAAWSTPSESQTMSVDVVRRIAAFPAAAATSPRRRAPPRPPGKTDPVGCRRCQRLHPEQRPRVPIADQHAPAQRPPAAQADGTSSVPAAIASR